MRWTVVIDESGNDGTSTVVTMAGLIANESHWAGFDREWRKLIDRHGLTEIHTFKLRNHLSRDPVKLKQIMAEVEELFLQCVAVSVTVVMRKDDYDEIYKPTRPKGGQKRSQLGVLYQALVSFAVSFLESYPPENLDSLGFIYEQVSNPGGYQAIHDEFKSHGDVATWFGPLSFATRTDVLGLQAADCLASGALQWEMELHGAEHTDIGNSDLVVADQQTNITAPMSFRLPVTREIIEALRDDLLLTKAARAAILQRFLRG
jgi:hypothetical protein